MASSSASGLALSIRQAVESEQFDLAGQNVDTITNTIQSAFAEPLPLKGQMIRITFVTGAGKQARQKYDDGAARAVTATLRDLGYEEDRAASCIVECAGTYKLQHDTGKNLKTVVVFPKIARTQGGTAGAGSDGQSLQSLVPEGCPAHKIAMSTTTTFERMLHSQCPSWSQKKGCMSALEHLKYMIDEMDAKLMKGTPLDDAEQDFYDHVTGLDDKISYVKEELHKQVENGGVTKFEKEMLLEHNAERLEHIATEKKSAKGQKLEKLKAVEEKMRERKDLLKNIDPIEPHKLRHEQAIAKLWKQVAPMLKIEETARGRLLSVKETQAVARKDELMEEIEELEAASRGWFEDEDAFDARLKAIRANFTSKLKQTSKGGKKSYAGAASVSITGNTTTGVRKDKWVTPGSDKKNAWGGTGPNKKKNKTQGSGVFAAMMAKSGSDSDDDEDEDDAATDDHDSDDSEVEEEKKSPATTKKSAPSSETANNNTEKKSGGKKKNKKNKGKKKPVADMSEDELLALGAAENKAAAKKAKEEQISHPAIDFVSQLISIILALIAWIVSIFVGKKKKS